MCVCVCVCVCVCFERLGGGVAGGWRGFGDVGVFANSTKHS